MKWYCHSRLSLSLPFKTSRADKYGSVRLTDCIRCAHEYAIKIGWSNTRKIRCTEIKRNKCCILSLNSFVVNGSYTNHVHNILNNLSVQKYCVFCRPAALWPKVLWFYFIFFHSLSQWFINFCSVFLLFMNLFGSFSNDL